MTADLEGEQHDWTFPPHFSAEFFDKFCFA